MVEQSERLESRGYAIIIQISTSKSERFLKYQNLSQVYSIGPNEGVIFGMSFSMKLNLHEIGQTVDNLLSHGLEIELIVYISSHEGDLVVISESGNADVIN